MAIFFSLTTHQKQVKCTASQLAIKKEQFLPRSASVIKWVLNNIRIFIFQSKNRLKIETSIAAKTAVLLCHVTQSL